MRITRRLKRILPVFLLILQILFSFAPLTTLIPAASAQEADLQPIQIDSQLSLDNYSGDFAVYYVVDGEIVAHQGVSEDGLDLFLGSASGEDQIKHDPDRVVVKIEGQTYHLLMQHIENNYVAGDLDLNVADEDFLFNDWRVEGSIATTKEVVRSGITYTFPLNSRVQVRFNRLPENPSALTIEEISLSAELQAELAAVSPVVYDVRTEMLDGEFSYDLILPKNESDDEVAVKYAESLADLEQADLVTEVVEVQKNTVMVNDLDHMTLFIVVKMADLGITLPFDGPDDNVGDVWVYRASAGAVTSLVTDPTGSVPEQWRTEVVSMDAPGLGRSYLGYRGFSWETVASSNLKEITWYKYAADTSNDHYLNFYIYQGLTKYGTVVIVPSCSGAGVWQQCSTDGVGVNVRYNYYSTSGWPWNWGWKSATQSFANFADFMQSSFSDWSFYNDPETDSSLTLISGSSTTSTDLLNYVDGIRFVYQDNSDDIYNFEAEADLIRPTVTLSPPAPVLTNQTMLAVDIEFSEEVNDLLASDLTLTNATVDSFNCSDTQNCQVKLRANTDGLVSMQVPENVVFDNAGFGNEASEIYSYMVDATAPTIPGLIFPTNNQFLKSSELYIDWSESTDNFTQNQELIYHYRLYSRDPVQNPNASFFGVTYTGSTRHPAAGFASGTGEGTYWYSVQAEDRAGNKSGFANYNKFTVDNTAPTATINGVAPRSLYSGNANIKVHAIDDNYLKTEFYREGESSPFKTYTGAWFGISWLAEGSYRMVVIDKAGNSTEYAFTIDKTNPTITVKAAPNSIGDFTNKLFSKVSFKLYDQYKIDKIALNGVEKDLGNNKWSDLNNVGVHNWFGEVEGANTLVAYDVAGNSTSYDFVLDRIAPVVYLTSPSTNYINSTIEIIGTVTDANPHHYWLVVQDSVNQKVAGPGTVNDKNSFTDKLFFNWDTTSVNDGDYTIKLEARDSADNKDAGSVVWKQFTVDNTPPESTILTPANEGHESIVVTNDWDGSLSGEASDNLSGVAKVELEIDYNGSTDVVTANGTTAWTYNLPGPLIEGTYTISSHAIDNAGNREDTYKVTIIYDKTIPEVDLSVNPADPDGSGSWYITRPEVTLTANDNFEVDYIQYRWGTTGSWSTYSTPLQSPSEGTNTLYYRAVDKANNISEEGIKTLQWDQTELTEGPLNVDADPNPTAETTSTISWDHAEDNIGISKYKVTWDLRDGDDKHSKEVAGDVTETEIDELEEGSYKITVTAYDGSGYNKSATTNLIVDRTAPVAPVLTLLAQRPGEVDLAWEAIEDADRYIIYYGLEAGNYLYAADVGNVTDYTVAGLTAGNYYFVVRAVDESDNQSANSNEVSILGLVGAPAGTIVAEGFAEAGEVQGETTEASEGEQAAMAEEIANQGQVKGATIACTSLSKSLFWLFLALQAAVMLLLAKFSKQGWLKLLAFLALPAVFTLIIMRTGLDNCFSSETMIWLTNNYYLPAYLTAMLTKILELFFIAE